MAVVALSFCSLRNCPQSPRDVEISVRGSLGEPLLRSRLDLVTFKSNPVLCKCSLSCSHGTGRESLAGGNSGEPLLRSRLDLVTFKSNPVLCKCSLSCSHGIGRESLAGGNSISNLGQEALGGRSRRAAGKPARAIKITRETAVGKEEEEDDDTEVCPVECVREFKSRSEFDEILDYSKEQGALVVVDFFKTACGSCRYIEKGFVKLCKGAGNTGVEVIFLKHNVMDEYEEQSEVADNLRIRVVPLFHFYKDGQLVESFATREKKKILETICKHTGLQLEDISIPRHV